jgi:hypothetical protein
VVADVAKLSVGREAYYTRELATDHRQYLSGHGESPGRWYGAAATTLGLHGEASPAGFQAMFEGRDPTTGELLGRPHGRNAVPAFDVVMRPARGCWRSGSTTGPPEKAIRCCTPTWSSPTASKARTDAGPPWTAEMSPATD